MRVIEWLLAQEEANTPTVTVEQHLGRWMLMVNGHSIVAGGDVCWSDKFVEHFWTPDMLRKVASGENVA